MPLNDINWSLSIPEIALAFSGLVILAAGVSQKKETAFFPCSMLTLASFLGCIFLVINAPDGSAFSGTFVNDSFSKAMKLLILASAILSVLVAVGYRGLSRTGERKRTLPFETPVLILFSTLGAMVMASSSNLMTLFVGLELSSLSIYILCALERENILSSEAGMKYFILGSLASGLLLYGMSLVYGYAGTMNYSGLMKTVDAVEVVPTGLTIGVIFIIAGLCFKLSVVPFHMWTPDAYQGAPTPVTAYMAGAPKFAAFALFLRIMTGPFGLVAQHWQLLIEVVAVCSMLYGSLAAIPQQNIKRLMAYSSIGHMGYALIGLAADSAEGVRATLVYLAAYLVMNAGVFGVIATMRRRGTEMTSISDLAGLGKRNPLMAGLMATFMFSMVGVPPLAGFFGKFMVFAAAWQVGLYTLVAIGVVSSIVGAYYYLNVVRVMYFEAPAEKFDRYAPALTLVSGSMGLATLFFLLVLSPIMSIAQQAAQALVG